MEIFERKKEDMVDEYYTLYEQLGEELGIDDFTEFLFQIAIIKSYINRDPIYEDMSYKKYKNLYFDKLELTLDTRKNLSNIGCIILVNSALHPELDDELFLIHETMLSKCNPSNLNSSVVTSTVEKKEDGTEVCTFNTYWNWDSDSQRQIHLSNQKARLIVVYNENNQISKIDFISQTDLDERNIHTTTRKTIENLDQENYIITDYFYTKPNYFEDAENEGKWIKLSPNEEKEEHEVKDLKDEHKMCLSLK